MIEINNLARRSDGLWESRFGSAPWTDAAELLTGSPVHCGRLLAGVVVGQTDRARPLIAPVAYGTAVGDELERVTGLAIRPEPIELAGVVRAWSATGPAALPSALLRADREVVPFQGRERILGEIRRWCDSPQRATGALVIGPVGQGKRRFARAVAETVRRQGWAVGELSDAPGDGWLTALASSGRPVFLVLDHAQTRAAQIRELAEHLTTEPNGPKVRVVLLATTADPWWPRLCGDGSVRAIFAEHPVRLNSVLDGLTGTLTALHEAASAYAAEPLLAGKAAASVDDGWSLWSGYDPSAEDAANIGRLHGIALATVLSGVPGGDGPVEDTLLDHEMRGWERAADRLSSEARPAWRSAVTAAVLFGAESERVALDTLRFVPRLKAASDAVHAELASWIRELYPPAEPHRRYWGTLEPEWLLRHFVADAGRESALLDTLLPSVTAAQARQALEVLFGVGSNELLDRVGGLLAVHPEILATEAVSLADGDQPGQAAARAMLEAVVADEHSDLPDAVGQAMLDRIPSPAGSLAGLETALHRRLILSYEAAVDGGSNRSRPDLAAQLCAYAVSRSEAGDHAEALERCRQALGHYEWLVESGPNQAAFLTPLAECLRLQATLTANAGRFSDAARVAGQAAKAYREIADTADPALRPRLATTLELLARYAEQAGDRTTAVTALTEAVEIHRAAAPSTAPHSVLVQALNDRVEALAQLASLISGPEKMVVRAESAETARRLHVADPVAYRRVYVDALTAYGQDLHAAGRVDDMMEVFRQVIGLWRQEAEVAPQTGLVSFAVASLSVSDRLAEAGRPEAAIDAAVEAVRSLQRLEQMQPNASTAQVALAHHTLGLRYAEAGKWKDAIDASSRAVAKFSELVQAGRDDERPRLASALNNLAAALATVDRHEEAATAAQQAMEALSTPDSLLDVRVMAAARTNAALSLARLGRPAESLELADEAVRLHRGTPGVPVEEVVRTLAAYRDGLLAGGDAATASVVAAEVVEHCRSHADPLQYAMALHESARCLCAVRNWGQGARTAAAAAQAYEQLVTDEERLLDERADVSMLHCVCLAEEGRPTEAGAAADHAVMLFRQRAGGTEVRDPAKLADALDAVCGLPERAASPATALAYAEEAVVQRRQAAENGDRTQVRLLIRALRQLARKRAAPDGLAPAREAVAQSRRLSELDSVAGPGEVAASLQELSRQLEAAGQERDSLGAASQAASESVRAYQVLADRDAAYLRPLASVLLDLSHQQMRLDDPMSALLSAQDALAALDRFEQANATAPALLVEVLTQLDLALAQVGHEPRRLDVAARKVQLLGELSRQDGRYQFDLGCALRWYATVQAGPDRLAEQEQAAGQAVQIHRAIARQDPRATAELAASLRGHAEVLKRLKKRSRAAELIREAEALGG